MTSAKDLLSWTIGIVLHMIIRCSDILDLDYQERVWIRQEGPEVDSFYDCSLILDDHIGVLLDTDSNKELTNRQKDMLQELSLYHEEVDVEHADGSSRGGRTDQAPDWLKLKDMVSALIPELAKLLLEPKIQKFTKENPGEFFPENWRQTVLNPRCEFTPEQQRKLLSLLP